MEDLVEIGRRRRVSFLEVFARASESSDYDAGDRLRACLAMAFNANVQRLVISFLQSKAKGTDAEAAMRAVSEDPSRIDPDTIERLLQLFIQYAPQILAIILKLIDAFS